MYKLLLILLGALLASCSKAPDLDAPCKEFGKYCHQEPINVEL